MSAAAPAAVARAGAVPPTPRPPGELTDRGAARRDRVHAERWVADGATKVAGDVDVGSAEVGGLTSVGGRVAAEDLTASGTIEVAGETHVARTLRVSGVGRFDGPVTAAEVEAAGEARFGAGLALDRALRFRGRVEVVGRLNAYLVRGDGQLSVGGPVTAHEIVLRLRGPSRAERLEADLVSVGRLGGPWGPGEALRVERIDAREALLEGVVAQYLKADRITLGPGCHIARADGVVVRRHRSSHVGPESRSPPPRGLSR